MQSAECRVQNAECRVRLLLKGKPIRRKEIQS